MTINRGRILRDAAIAIAATQVGIPGLVHAKPTTDLMIRRRVA